MHYPHREHVSDGVRCAQALATEAGAPAGSGAYLSTTPSYVKVASSASATPASPSTPRGCARAKRTKCSATRKRRAQPKETSAADATFGSCASHVASSSTVGSAAAEDAMAYAADEASSATISSSAAGPGPRSSAALGWRRQQREQWRRARREPPMIERAMGGARGQARRRGDGAREERAARMRRGRWSGRRRWPRAPRRPSQPSCCSCRQRARTCRRQASSQAPPAADRALAAARCREHCASQDG